MFGNIKRKQNPSSDGREFVKLFGCQNSQYVKVDVCRFHYLKNGLSLSRFSFLLFCRLLVLWQKIVASFLGHVACLFYPLEGLTIQHHTLRNELGLSLQTLYPRHYAAATNSYTNLEMTKHVAKFLV